MNTETSMEEFSEKLQRPFCDIEKYYRVSECMFKNIYQKYSSEYSNLCDTVSSRTHYNTYSLLPASKYDLDYYSPFHDDLFVWGAKRGRMAKRISPRSKIGSEYLYDENGNLICVRTRRSFDPCGLFSHHTFLKYENSERRVLSLDFELNEKETYELQTISLFSYNERHKMVLAEKCDALNYSHSNNSLYTRMWSNVAPVEFDVEINEYDDLGQLLTVLSTSYFPVVDGFSNVFDFLKDKVVDFHAWPIRRIIRDEDGYLSKYEERGVEYNILGSKNKKIRDVPQLPNLDRIFH